MARFVPRLQPQLGRGSPTERRDCGPRTVQMGVAALTHGELVPDIPEIRDRMGQGGNQTTNVFDAQEAVESFRHVPGRRPLHYAVLRTSGDVKAAVQHGRPVQLAISYGAFNASGKTGDPAFRGGHSVLVVGQRVKDGEVQYRLLDPLDDARRAGIPQGPRFVARERLIHALEAFSPGTVFAGSFTGGARHG